MLGIHIAFKVADVKGIISLIYEKYLHLEWSAETRY